MYLCHKELLAVELQLGNGLADVVQRAVAQDLLRRGGEDVWMPTSAT